MSELLFNTSLFDDFERFQRQMSSLFSGLPSGIRASRLTTFPNIHPGSTDDSVEVVAFAPGMDPAKLELTVDKGLLTISGERAGVESFRLESVPRLPWRLKYRNESVARSSKWPINCSCVFARRAAFPDGACVDFMSIPGRFLRIGCFDVYIRTACLPH